MYMKKVILGVCLLVVGAYLGSNYKGQLVNEFEVSAMSTEINVIKRETTGAEVRYSNQGGVYGQRFIDENPDSLSTWTYTDRWGLTLEHSNTDGKPTMFTGYTSHAMKELSYLKLGEVLLVTDSSGDTAEYKVVSRVELTNTGNQLTHQYVSILEETQGEVIQLYSALNDDNTLNQLTILEKVE